MVPRSRPEQRHEQGGGWGGGRQSIKDVGRTVKTSVANTVPVSTIPRTPEFDVSNACQKRGVGVAGGGIVQLGQGGARDILHASCKPGGEAQAGQHSNARGLYEWGLRSVRERWGALGPRLDPCLGDWNSVARLLPACSA